MQWKQENLWGRRKGSEGQGQGLGQKRIGQVLVRVSLTGDKGRNHTDTWGSTSRASNSQNCENNKVALGH